MIASQKHELIFEGGFDEREALECRDRGYRSHVCVKFSNGECYPVVFYDPVRLQQDLEGEAKMGNPFIAEPGLIVLPEVTLDNMNKAVWQLAENGFFESLRPAAHGSVTAINR